MNGCNDVWPCGSGAVVVRAPAACNCPPSPEPPWARARQSPTTQTLGQAGTVSLTADPTYLDLATGIAESTPVAIVLPDGNFKGQTKRIYIPGDKLGTTET